MVNNDKIADENFKKNDAALRQEWGADYDKNFNQTMLMLTKALGEEGIKELAPQLKNAPLAVKGFQKISSMLSEDSLKSLGMSNLNPQEENEEKMFNEYAEAIRTGDMKHPINDTKSKDHDQAVANWTRFGGKYNLKR